MMCVSHNLHSNSCCCRTHHNPIALSFPFSKPSYARAFLACYSPEHWACCYSLDYVCAYRDVAPIQSNFSTEQFLLRNSLLATFTDKFRRSCRGLEGMLNTRRKLLQYLRKKDFDRYSVLLVRLGLKDNFAIQVNLIFAIPAPYNPIPKLLN